MQAVRLSAGEEMKKTFRYQGRKCHLLGEAMDGLYNIILYKYWRVGKARWEYEAEQEWLIDYYNEASKDASK